MYVAKEGFGPPIASPELAVLPLHYLALCKLPIFADWQFVTILTLILLMSTMSSRGRTQTCNSCVYKVLSIKTTRPFNTSILTNRCLD